MTANQHGWFSVPGIQTGEHTLKDRIGAIPHIVRKRAQGATILDVGCAEGLMSKWLIDCCGAASFDGLDIHEPFLKTGAALLQGYDARLFHVDLNFLKVWRDQNPDSLRIAYDIVIATCIAQKMARPIELLRQLVELSDGLILIQCPSEIIKDDRSLNVEVSITDALAPEFKPIQRGQSPIGDFLAVYERT